jgi:cytochrome c oxidase cbb3-type subunit III
MMRRLVAGALAAAALLVAGATAHSPVDAGTQHERGRAVYNFRCYFCHGYSGDARTVAAGMLAVRPRDFTAARPGELSREQVLAALRHGRPGTAMASFAGTLSPAEMEAVAAFVVAEFVVGRRPNTRYHTAENGWPDHDRFRDAFRFVEEPSTLALPQDQLDEAGRRGRALYRSACVTCHDAGGGDTAVAWDARPVSYPADGHDCVSCHDRVRYPERGLERLAPPASYHGAAGLPPAGPGGAADLYSRHDRPVQLAGASAVVRRGEILYLKNCAFCHAADGTARHWIGRFLEPHPRDLTDAAFRGRMDRARLVQRIEEGLPGTAMPTWRNVLDGDEIRAIASYMEAAFGPLGRRAN